MIDQHKSLLEKFFEKGLPLYFFSFLIGPIWYVIKIIVSGDISVSELWILYGVLSFVALLSSFNDFGMTESMNYFVPEYLQKNDYSRVKSLIAYAFITQVITWIAIASILFLWSEYLASSYFKSDVAGDILKIFAFYFLWINIFQVFNNFFLAVQNTFYHQVTEFLKMFFVLSFTVALLVLDLWNVISYASAWVFGLYFGIIFVLYFFYRSYYRNFLSWVHIIWSQIFFKSIFSYAIVVFIWTQGVMLLSQMDMQMVIYLLGTQEAWYYTNYLSMMMIPFMILWPIFWLLFPLFSEMNAKKQYDKIKLVKQILSKNFIAVCVAFNILMFVFAETIAYILFWERYIASGVILQYSILFLVFNFLLQINFYILAWIWRVKQRLAIIVVALFFNFFLNLLLIKTILVEWAALATGLWWVWIYAMSEYLLGKRYFHHLDYRFLIKNIISIWLLGIFCFYFITPLFSSYGRLYSLFFMTIISLFWFWFFILMNYKEFRRTILDMQRLKKELD